MSDSQSQGFSIERRFFEDFWAASRHRFLLLALVPTFLVFIYTALLASPIYISTAQFAIRNLEAGGGAAPGMDFIQQLIGGGEKSAIGDSYLITQYAVSWDIFSKIDAQLGLKGHFQDTSRDMISRLSSGATQNDVLDYWAWVVKLNFDRDTGLISCKVKAYTPEMARRINQLIIEYSEVLINEMNRRGYQDSLAMAQAEVEKAEERLSRAHAAMRRMREKTTQISAQAATETLQTIIVNLEVEAAKTAAELKELRSYMRDDSPAVEALKRRLDAISGQLASERGKVSGFNGDSPEHLSAMVGEFQDLQLEEEFARQQYTAALTALEGVRIKGETKNRYLVAFEPPLLPDESLYPPVVKATVLTFLGAVLLLGLGSLITAAIREHAGF
ncbi:MAG: capsule biosynthesis protein [Deltaproteobacteria bacterium]|nr:capsule biosynthesis protein [Deltaproteobacteria bacterium]